MDKNTIIQKMSGINNKCTFYYDEKYDKESNQVIIEAKMTFDLSSKAAVNKLNKAWKKDKSPMLLELQQMFRNHERLKKEDKEEIWYTPIE